MQGRCLLTDAVGLAWSCTTAWRWLKVPRSTSCPLRRTWFPARPPCSSVELACIDHLMLQIGNLASKCC